MIEIHSLTKSFEKIKAVDEVSVTIKDNIVFGLIGTNGAGKSTVLRMISGVLKPDSGTVTVDHMPVYDNVEAKKQLFFIADEPYFFANSNARAMERYYSGVYENFDRKEFYRYLESFNLDKGRKINTYSKGMKKQLALLLGICAHTKYLLCDETFDGLDPVMRQGVKSILAKEMEERGLTPVIASHNLRELEDICDHVGLLHRGGILFSRDLDDMKLGINKAQCVFDQPVTKEDFAPLEVMQLEKRGSLYTVTVRAGRDELEAQVQQLKPIFYEILPLTLEEIFISETEVRGYDIKKLLF